MYEKDRLETTHYVLMELIKILRDTSLRNLEDQSGNLQIKGRIDIELKVREMKTMIDRGRDALIYLCLDQTFDTL